MPNCDMCFAPIGPDGLCMNNPHHHQRPTGPGTPYRVPVPPGQAQSRAVRPGEGHIVRVPLPPEGVQAGPPQAGDAVQYITAAPVLYAETRTLGPGGRWEVFRGPERDYSDWAREQAERINQSMMNTLGSMIGPAGPTSPTEGEAPMPPRSTVADTVERVTRPASNVDTMTKFGLSEPDWKALPMPCKFALIEAAGLLKEPPRVEDDFVPGIFMVMGSDCDGENYESLVSAPNRDAAIQCFMDYCDREEWDSGPYVYKIPARSNRRGVLNWVHA